MKTQKEKQAIWIMFETDEIIELKRIALDREVEEAVAFFQTVIAPRVGAAAERLGIRQLDDTATDDWHLPG